MKLFLDDERIPKTPGWSVVRTATEAIELIRLGYVTEISLDHDLGTELTGYDVAAFIERSVILGEIRMPKWNVHSANPVGRDRISQALKNAERFIAG